MRTVRSFALSVLLLLLAAPSAGSFVSDGQPTWQGSTVRYHVKPMAPADRAKVLQAVAAWNAAGARMRLAPGPLRTAQVVVEAPSKPDSCSGVARTTFVDGKRSRSRVIWRRCRERLHDVRTLAHEIGHALGLEHEPRRCAVMSSPSIDGVPHTCRDGRGLPAWQVYCAVLEADDVRGLVRRYGGTARIPARRICARGPAPAAATNLVGSVALEADGTPAMTFSWTTPPAPPAKLVKVVYRLGTCPTAWDDPDRLTYTDVEVVGPTGFDTWVNPPTGTVCAMVQAFDEWGQPGPASAGVSVVVPERTPTT